MAVLTLDASVPYTIKYTISDMISEYVFSAVVQLSDGEDPNATILKVNSHQAIDTAYTENITGEFIGLTPNHYYRVTSRVYDELGRETSNQTQYITTVSVNLNPDPYSKHSIIISTKNTYDEWGLIPTERPIVKPATVKSSFIELPGSSESIDFTEILTGMVHYGQRTGTWTFDFDSDAPKFSSGRYLELKIQGRLWEYIYSELLTYTHGKVHSIVLEDEPDKVYTGRLTVTKWDSSSKFSRVSIEYNIDPPERIISDTMYTKIMTQSAKNWNALVNGNTNFLTQPMVSQSQMASAGWSLEKDYMKVYKMVLQNMGDYTVMFNPILVGGNILSPSALQYNVSRLYTTGTPAQLLSSDSSHIIVAYTRGHYDTNYWNKLKNSLKYYEDQYLKAWKFVNGIRG